MATNVSSDLRRPRWLWPLGFVRRARRRAAADAWIVERAHAFSPNTAVHGRIDELTSPRTRTRLAGSLQGAVRDAERIGISASPLNRRAVSECSRELTELAERLEDDRPVGSRGVALVLRLLTDGSSPLYGSGNGARLEAQVAVIRSALDDA
jgi:hypothetical protein